MKIEEMINKFRTLPNCAVWPPNGLPVTDASHPIPDDVLEFYRLCGGMSVFNEDRCGINIVAPEDVKPADSIILEPKTAHFRTNELSKDFYVIGYDEDSQWITIDLNPNRLGRCYESFWDSYAGPGTSPIIALSFSQLLEHFISFQDADFWDMPNFEAYGDAYD